ncbi:MAG: hypothetical protein FWH16_01930 [Oscillospiraceae bacterium]|nr:hypothetical protein [Oscillospiraceae bacterium]
MKNDSPKVLGVLERMGMVRRSEEEAAEPAGQADLAEETVLEPQPFEDVEPEAEAAAPEPVFSAEPEPEPVYEPVSKPAAFAAYIAAEKKEDIKSGVGEKMSEASFWDDSPALNTDTDRFMEVEDIYRALALKTGGTDTIYLVEEYMRTLPDSLPAESRRAIIMKIVGASGFDFDRLLNDGIDRVTKLNEYAASFAQQTDKIVARHNSELDALEKQIQRVRELIGDRKNLHKRQFLAIENEAQRLKEVLDFVTK